MATMTADGVRLARPDGVGHLIVPLGSRVRLKNGWTGKAYNWTRKGVAVQLDPVAGLLPPWWDGLAVWAVDAGDGDISEVL